MIYGVVCFALLFSFTGTILGGIWADQSWGRFWGWDPKENGAVLIVLWNALILHARWGGLIRHRGLAVLAVLGNVVTAFSWFGTNLLGIGLHSYGFTQTGFLWLAGFTAIQLLLTLLALAPPSAHRSIPR
jgi:ABC-type transport system involved in cytochrome c biogenesis permease subunit